MLQNVENFYNVYNVRNKFALLWGEAQFCLKVNNLPIVIL